MKKNVLLFVGTTILMLLNSCIQDNLEETTVKTYASDRAILEYFAEIDITNVKYFLNLNPEKEVLELIPHNILNEVRNTAEDNINRFQTELDEINSLLEESLQTADYMELNNKYKKVLIKVENKRPASIEITPKKNENKVDSINLRTSSGTKGYYLGNFLFTHGTPVPVSFNAKDRLISETSILSPEAYIYAKIKCDTGVSTGAPSNSTPTEEVSEIIISEISTTYNYTHYWKNTKNQGNSVRWNFYLTKISNTLSAEFSVYEEGKPYPVPKNVGLYNTQTQEFLKSEKGQVLIFPDYMATTSYVGSVAVFEEHLIRKWIPGSINDPLNGKFVYVIENVLVTYELKVSSNGTITSLYARFREEGLPVVGGGNINETLIPTNNYIIKNY